MASSVRSIVLIDNDDPMGTSAQVAKTWAQGNKTASDGSENEVGIGFVACEVEQVGSLSDSAIWICKNQLIELKGKFDGMLKLWIPVKGKPGVKDEHFLCQHTGLLYKIPSGNLVGYIKDVIPEAAELLIEAFSMRDEVLQSQNQFNEAKIGDAKHAPALIKGQKYELAFPLSRKQSARYGYENPGDLVVFMRNVETGHTAYCLPPQDRIDDMDWNDHDKISWANKWRGQLCGRRLGGIRFDREEKKMWTQHEHHNLLGYVIRNAYAYFISKGVNPDDFLMRLNSNAVVEWCQEHFSPQITRRFVSSYFAIYDIDRPEPGQGFDQMKTLRSDRNTFDHTAEEIMERIAEQDIFADIMKLDVDEHALKDEAKWAKFLLTEPEKAKKVRNSKPKTGDKVLSGRVVKVQPKTKASEAKKKSRGGSQDSAIEVQEFDASAINADKENEDAGDAGDAGKPSTPPRSITARATRTFARCK